MNYCGFILLLKIIMNENQFKNSMSLELKRSSALNVCFVLFCSVTHSKTKKKKNKNSVTNLQSNSWQLKVQNQIYSEKNQFGKNL